MQVKKRKEELREGENKRDNEKVMVECKNLLLSVREKREGKD